MICRQVCDLIPSYVDDQLDGAARLRVAAHLEACDDCAREEAELRDLGHLLRGSAMPVSLAIDDLAGLASGVISRIGAEERLSWRARGSRLFDDWHWVAVGSGACAAAFVTVVLVAAMLYSPTSQARQKDARVGTLYVMAVPEDGKGEPVVFEYGPSLEPGARDHRYAMPASFGWRAEQELVSALDRSLMRDGRHVPFEELTPEQREEVAALFNELARLRQYSPARRPKGLTNVSGMHLVLNEVVTAAGL